MTATAAPSAASFFAMAAPSPRLAPVISATRPSSRPMSARRFKLEGTADEFLEHLVRTGIYALHPAVAPEPGDLVLVHVAVTTEQLQAPVNDLALAVGDPLLDG